MNKKLEKSLQEVLPDNPKVFVDCISDITYGASGKIYKFTARWEQDGTVARSLILRQQPEKKLLDVDIAREYKILQALTSTVIPAPGVYALLTDGEYSSRPAMIMDQLPGQTGRVLEPFSGSQPQREEIGEKFTVLLAELHNIDWQSLGLGFLDRPDYARTQVCRWKQVIENCALEPDPIAIEAILWLESHIPSTERKALVHGDYKFDNILYEENRITGLLDWEMAAIGDPLEDVAWACMGYYQFDGLLNGLITQEKFLEMYQSKVSFSFNQNELKFWLILANLKMLAISTKGGHLYFEHKVRKNVHALIYFLIPRLHAELVELMEF